MYRWVLDFGEVSESKNYPTLQKAIQAASKQLADRREYCERFSRDTLPDIRQGLETLENTPFEGRTLRVCIDRHTNFYMTIRIRREQIPPEEMAKIEAAKAARRKDKAPR